MLMDSRGPARMDVSRIQDAAAGLIDARLAPPERADAPPTPAPPADPDPDPPLPLISGPDVPSGLGEDDNDPLTSGFGPYGCGAILRRAVRDV